MLGTLSTSFDILH